MRKLPWLLKNPMGGQNFKLPGRQIWLQIKIPLKTLIIESFFFLKNSGTPSKLNFHF